jgi:hypothetical protein
VVTYGFIRLRTIFGSRLRLPIAAVADEPIAPALVIRTSSFVPFLSSRLRPNSDVSVFLPSLTFP